MRRRCPTGALRGGEVEPPGQGPRGGPVADGQVRGDVERLGQVAAGGRGHAEVGLDLGQVVPEQPVASAEADRGAGVGEGLAGLPGLAQGPAEGVVGIDGRPVGQGPPGHGHGPSEVGAGVAGVVGLEPGQLQVDGHPVGLVQPLDHPHQAVLGGGGLGVAEGGPDVAEHGHGRRQGQAGGHRLQEPGRPGQVPAGGRDPGQADLGQAVAGPDVKGPAVGGRRRGQATRPQVQVADERLDIRAVGRRVAAGGGRLDHGRDRPGGVAEELAGVGDPGQAALGRLAVHHRLGGGHGRLVAAQFHLGVEDHPEGVGQVRVGLGRPHPPAEGGPEVVAAELEQAAGDHRVGVAGRQLGGLAQHPGRLGVEGRVGGLPGPGQIRDTEPGEQPGLVRPPPQLGLEPSHLGGGVGAGHRPRRPHRPTVAGEQEPPGQQPGGQGHNEHGHRQRPAGREGPGSPGPSRQPLATASWCCHGRSAGRWRPPGGGCRRTGTG